MNFDDLKNPELQEKLKAAKSAEELVELAREEGLELTDDQLAAVAGGENVWSQIHDDDCANFEVEVCWSY